MNTDPVSDQQTTDQLASQKDKEGVDSIGKAVAQVSSDIEYMSRRLDTLERYMGIGPDGNSFNAVTES